jgi:hypothetical protein
MPRLGAAGPPVPPRVRARAAVLLLCGAVLGAGARPLAAQAPAAPPPASQPATPRVRVAGVVYDSLLGAPLPGATVTRDGEQGVAFTDSAGRFALDDVAAVPGRFVLSHPGLDSAGLADVPVPFDLSPGPGGSGAEVWVRLATPSLATLRARACPADGTGTAAARGAARRPAAPGFVFGEVVDAVTGDRLAGAGAAVTWTQVDTAARPFAVRAERRDAVSDSLGTWVACGVPLGSALEARAAAGGVESGRAAFAVGPRGVARLDLWVPPRGTVSPGDGPATPGAAGHAPPPGVVPAGPAPSGTAPSARRRRRRASPGSAA